MIEIAVDDGAFQLKIATPAAVPAATVIIVPSIFGLNEESDRWLSVYSAEGFLTAVYDPFWRTDPGALSVTDPAERVRAQARRDAFEVEAGVRDLRAAIAAMRARPESNGNVAVGGYCFGGRYAMIAAARLDVQAAFSFHGISMGDSLEDARNIRVPVSFHFGDDDHSTPMSEVRAIQAAVEGNPLVELCVYAGVGHSYTWHGHRLHHPVADAESWQRAMAVLAPLRKRRGDELLTQNSSHSS
jgi:carboxymethylenebutenolidase